MSFRREIPGVCGPFPVNAPITLANPKLQWCWLSGQPPDGVLAMKIFDSENEMAPDNTAGAVHHSSFYLPGTIGHEVGESLETKFFAFW